MCMSVRACHRSATGKGKLANITQSFYQQNLFAGCNQNIAESDEAQAETPSEVGIKRPQDHTPIFTYKNCFHMCVCKVRLFKSNTRCGISYVQCRYMQSWASQFYFHH